MDQQTSTTEKEKPRRWAQAFLSALAECGNVSGACKAAKIDRKSAYLLRAESPDFAEAWEDAKIQASDSLEHEAVRRARDGVNEPVIHQGELCGLWVDAEGNRVAKDTPDSTFIPLTVKKYSDTLLIFLMKGNDPEKYRDNYKMTGPGPAGEFMVKVVGGTASLEDL